MNFIILQCIDVILDKFKEKKTNVVTALRGAIDAVFQTVNIVCKSFLFTSPNSKRKLYLLC